MLYTRPDVAFALGITNTFYVDVGEKHGEAIRSILK